MTTIDETIKHYSRSLVNLKLELDDLKRVTEHKIAKSKAQATVMTGKTVAATNRIDKTSNLSKSISKDIDCERKVQKHLKHKLLITKKKHVWSQEHIAVTDFTITECNKRLGRRR